MHSQVIMFFFAYQLRSPVVVQSWNLEGFICTGSGGCLDLCKIEDSVYMVFFFVRAVPNATQT